MPGPALVFAITLLARDRKRAVVVEPSGAALLPSGNVTASAMEAPLKVKALLQAGFVKEEAERRMKEQASRIAELERRLGSMERRPARVSPDAAALGAFYAVEQDSGEERLVPLFTASMGAPIRALALSRQIVFQGSPLLVAAADAKGNLWVYNRSGELQLTAPLGHAPHSPIVGLALGSRDDPFVASATSDGQIRIHNLTLPRLLSRAAAAASALAGSSDVAEVPASLSLDVALRIPSSGDDASSSLRKRALPAQIISLDSYTKDRRTQLLAIDAQGTVFTIARDGSVRKKVALGGAATATARNGAVIAVATRGALLLVDISKPVAKPTACEASALLGSVSPGSSELHSGLGEITSLAWDLELPQLLYAATSSGEILLFNTRTRTRSRQAEPSASRANAAASRPGPACRLVERLRGHQPSTLSIAAVRGYLLSASPSLLAAHNVSGLYARAKLAPEAVYGKPLGKHTRSSGGAAVLIAASPAAASPLSSFSPAPPLVALGHGPTGTLTLFSSRLPFDKPKPEKLFRSLPSNPLLVAVAVMGVVWAFAKAARALSGAGSMPEGMPPGFPGLESMPGMDMPNDPVLLRVMAMASSGGRAVSGAPLGEKGVPRRGGGGKQPRALYGASGMSARRVAEEDYIEME